MPKLFREEEQNCPLCKMTKFRIFMSNCKDVFYRCKGEWTLLECSNCHAIFTSPLWNQTRIQEFYPKEYSSYNTSTEVRHNPVGDILRKIAMLPYLLRFGNSDWEEFPFGKGRVLDVGCGSGTRLKSWNALGWKCWGLDVSPVAVELSMKNIPEATIYHGSLTDLPLREKFNVVLLSQVLEHLPNPAESLKKCFEILEPGGKLFIGIPNIESIEAKLFGRNWRGLDIPRHIVHFSEPVIRHLLEVSGFTVNKIRPAMFASSISESLIMMFPKKIRYRILHSTVSRYFYLLMVFPAAVSYLLGNRGIIEVVACKLKDTQNGVKD